MIWSKFHYFHAIIPFNENISIVYCFNEDIFILQHSIKFILVLKQ